MRQPKPVLTDPMWERVKRFFPDEPPGKTGGRPRVGNRACLEGILWVLRTGARWGDMPNEYPSPATCWRRLQEWEKSGAWIKAWRSLLSEMDADGLLELREAFLDASFSPAKKGARQWVLLAKAKEPSGSWWQTVAALQSELLSRVQAQQNPNWPKLLSKAS